MNVFALITHPVVLIASVLVVNVAILRRHPGERPSIADIFEAALGLLVTPDSSPAQRAVPEPEFEPFRLDMLSAVTRTAELDEPAAASELAPAAA